MSWTEARIDTLKTLAADGLSASQIAAEMGGLTRNAVLGKLHRLGTQLVKKPGRPTGLKPRTKALHRTQFNRRRVAELANLNPAVVALPPDQSPFACTIMDLTEKSCKWPLGTPSHDMHYCGDGKMSFGPYCPRHARLAWRPGERP